MGKNYLLCENVGIQRETVLLILGGTNFFMTWVKLIVIKPVLMFK